MARYRMRSIFVETLWRRGAPYSVDEAEWIEEFLRVSRAPGRRQKFKLAVEAFRWDHGREPYPDWFLPFLENETAKYDDEGEKMTIETPSGIIHVNRFDFVIRGLKADVYTCPAESFCWRYEPA